MAESVSEWPSCLVSPNSALNKAKKSPALIKEAGLFRDRISEKRTFCDW